MDRIPGQSREPARLSARPPGTPPAGLAVTGETVLGVESGRDTLLYVPTGIQAGKPGPLVVLFHGAGGAASGGLSLLRPLADSYNLVLAAPSSRGSTWDGVGGHFGPDVDVVDRALQRVFERVQVDPGRVAVGGFSDGASYALGLGLANGDLFTKVIAFSPGYVPPARRAGKPAIFVSHGVFDEVLPINRTSRMLVPALNNDGYEVSYHEFEGPHTVPPDIASEAVGWLGWEA